MARSRLWHHFLSHKAKGGSINLDGLVTANHLSAPMRGGLQEDPGAAEVSMSWVPLHNQAAQAMTLLDRVRIWGSISISAAHGKPQQAVTSSFPSLG